MPGPVKPKPSAKRSIGLTLGDLWSVIKTGKARSPITKQVVRRDVQEAKVETDSGPVTLRRTTVDGCPSVPRPLREDRRRPLRPDRVIGRPGMRESVGGQRREISHDGTPGVCHPCGR